MSELKEHTCRAAGDRPTVPGAAGKTARPGLSGLLTQRWSPRKFTAKAPDDEALALLFAAARLAPSSFNEQPWSFVVVERRDREAFSRMLGILNERNRAWAERAPLLVLAVARTRVTRTGGVNFYAL